MVFRIPAIGAGPEDAKSRAPMALLTRNYTRTALPSLRRVYVAPINRIWVCRCAGGWVTTQPGRLLSSDGNRRRTPAPPVQAACATVESHASSTYVAPADDWLQRSRLLVGADGVAKLSAVNVLLVGLGGVGSFVAEFLCRAGVGHMTIVDGDTVDTTNRNRQLPAMKSTVGQLKAELVASRLKDINPEMQLTVEQEFLDPLRAAALVQEQPYHYVLDCIDSVAPKQALLLAGHAAGCKVVSSMGAGGRMDPSRVRLTDISQTYNDAFAAVVRRGLRKAGITHGVTVVFSDELAKPASLALTQQQYKKSYFGTCSYIPALFGLYMASHVIRDVVDSRYKVPNSAASLTGSSIKKAASSNGRSNNRIKQRKPTQLEGQQQKQHQHQHQHHQDDQVTRLSSATNEQQSLLEVPAAKAAVPAGLLHSSQQTQKQQAPSSVKKVEIQNLTNVLRIFEQSQGTGMGYDGDGI